MHADPSGGDSMAQSSVIVACRMMEWDAAATS